MDAAALPDSGNRASLYFRLQRRNRLIAFLRLAVPFVGLLVFAVLGIQIYIANLAENYGISGIRFERDALILDQPAYEGVMANGTSYKVVAREAVSQVGSSEKLDLIDAIIDLVRPDGFAIHATTKLAHYDLVAQTVIVPGEMIVTDSKGTEAFLVNSFIDWAAQTLHARENVRVNYPDGTTIRAKTLIFRAATSEWEFTRSVLTTGGGVSEEAD